MWAGWLTAMDRSSWSRATATISHEINNPLESVTNLLYIVRMSTNEKRILVHLRVAEEELARVTQIVKRYAFLTLSPRIYRPNLGTHSRNATDPSSHRPGVRVTVADTGHGMDQQTVERLSEPFFTTKGNNGSGLGLWINYGILQKHQAIMRVRSRCKGNKRDDLFHLFPSQWRVTTSGPVMGKDSGGLNSPKTTAREMSADIVRAASRNFTVKS